VALPGSQSHHHALRAVSRGAALARAIRIIERPRLHLNDNLPQRHLSRCSRRLVNVLLADEVQQRVDILHGAAGAQRRAHDAGRPPQVQLHHVLAGVAHAHVHLAQVARRPAQVRRHAARVAVPAAAHEDALAVGRPLHVLEAHRRPVRPQHVEGQRCALRRRIAVHRAVVLIHGKNRRTTAVPRRHHARVSGRRQRRGAAGDSGHGVGAVQVVVGAEGVAERDDVVEGQGAALELRRQGRALDVPAGGLAAAGAAAALCCHHVDRAAAEVPPRRDDARCRRLAHDQPAQVREAEDLVEGHREEVGLHRVEV